MSLAFSGQHVLCYCTVQYFSRETFTQIEKVNFAQETAAEIETDIGATAHFRSTSESRYTQSDDYWGFSLSLYYFTVFNLQYKLPFPTVVMICFYINKIEMKNGIEMC